MINPSHPVQAVQVVPTCYNEGLAQSNTIISFNETLQGVQGFGGMAHLSPCVHT